MISHFERTRGIAAQEQSEGHVPRPFISIEPYKGQGHVQHHTHSSSPHSHGDSANQHGDSENAALMKGVERRPPKAGVEKNTRRRTQDNNNEEVEAEPNPTTLPMAIPSLLPIFSPTETPTAPSQSPTVVPSLIPTFSPTESPTVPSQSPTVAPPLTTRPTFIPSPLPTADVTCDYCLGSVGCFFGGRNDCVWAECTGFACVQCVHIKGLCTDQCPGASSATECLAQINETPTGSPTKQLEGEDDVQEVEDDGTEAACDDDNDSCPVWAYT
jgi:hypothetical protein